MQNKNLSIREIKFAEEYTKNGFNGSKAYRVAYETDNNNVAKAEAWKMLKMQKIQDAISASERGYRQLAREMQMDRRSVLAQLRDVIMGENRSSKEKLAGINMLVRLTGDLNPQKQEIEIEYSSKSLDISQLSAEDIKELQAKIISEM